MNMMRWLMVVGGLLLVLAGRGATTLSQDGQLTYEIKLDTILKHDDRKFLWYHPRAVARPALGEERPVLITLQQHLHTSDHYSGLYVMHSTDLGKTWTPPEARPELAWTPVGKDVNVAVADVTPGWHARTGKVIAVGAQVRYSPKGAQLEDEQRSHQTAYAVYDPMARTWTPWRRLEMPAEAQFDFARSACSQWVAQPDGTILLPFYIGKNARVPWDVTVVACQFDGDALKYQRHGNLLSLPVARGLCEPSLVTFQGKYYLTIRNDVKGYVSVSDDGLHYQPIRPWRFDDGQELGSYNTQQHWLGHSNGLFLVYTRRGAKNDHMFRHRAPLFIGQVDPKTLRVVRKSERVLIPERGGEMGNFGACAISPHESWVTVSEGIWNEESRKRGAQGATFIARVQWSLPNRDLIK